MKKTNIVSFVFCRKELAIVLNLTFIFQFSDEFLEITEVSGSICNIPPSNMRTYIIGLRTQDAGYFFLLFESLFFPWTPTSCCQD